LKDCVCPLNKYVKAFKVVKLFLKQPALLKNSPSISVHFTTRVGTWSVARLYSGKYVFRKPFGIKYMYMFITLVRMTED
jgi:hypothetical protein